MKTKSKFVENSPAMIGWQALHLVNSYIAGVGQAAWCKEGKGHVDHGILP